MLLKSIYSDIDELNESIRTWDLDFRQLEKGPFRGDVCQFVGDNVQFARARFNRRLEQLGGTPRTLRTFGVPVGPTLPFHWRGRDIGRNQILVVPLNGDLYSVSTSRFSIFTISLSEEVLASTCGLRGLPDLDELIGEREVLNCSPELMRGLQQFCIQIHCRMEKDLSPLEAMSLQRALNSELADVLLTALASSSPAPTPSPPRLRSAALRRSLEYIREHPTDAITVRDLAIMSGASWRTLDYAFLERFGITPTKYLKALRLHGVHRDLRRTDASSTKVSEVASKWGFSHMGRFTGDYRSFFVEPPSVTLKRRRGLM